MNADGVSLCCCEYLDENRQRNHLLACCCNCEDLDESVESLITGQSVPASRRSAVMRTILDRLRVPWRGGAKQISPDTLLPVLLVPLALLHSALSLWRTVITFSFLFLFLLLFSRHLSRNVPRTKFFLSWTATTVIVQYLIFEFVVIPFLQILLEENVVLSLLIVGFAVSVWRTRRRGGGMGSDAGCSVCRMAVDGWDRHCVWYDCCINSHNRLPFVLSLLFALSALLYSSDLTLTSVCHPFVLYRTILLPDDCSEAYEQYELGLAFVSAIYGLVVAAGVAVALLWQCMAGLRWWCREWRRTVQ